MYALSTILAFIATAKDRRDEKGATAVEYGLLVVLIAAIIIGTVATIGTDVLAGFKKVADALPTT